MAGAAALAPRALELVNKNERKTKQPTIISRQSSFGKRQIRMDPAEDPSGTHEHELDGESGDKRDVFGLLRGHPLFGSLVPRDSEPHTVRFAMRRGSSPLPRSVVLAIVTAPVCVSYTVDECVKLTIGRSTKRFVARI